MSIQKKILIISRSFYPANSPRSHRTTELVKEFARKGHDVTLITPRNEKYHKQFEKKYGVKIKDLGPIHLQKINIPAEGYLHWPKRILRRILLQLFEYPDMELMYRVKKALKQEKGYDLLISIATPYPIHWGVAWARTPKRRIARIWIADCGDPYMGLENDSFNKFFYFKFLEKWFCRKSDFITIPFKGAVEAYYQEFRKKIKVIPQGFRFEEIKTVDETEPNEVPTFAYAGGLIKGKDPRGFIEYLLAKDMDFHFYIYSNDIALIDSYLQNGEDRIKIMDFIPRKKLLYEISKMDFLVNFEYKLPTQLSIKLIDYAIVGKPILSINMNNLNTLKIDQFLDGDYSQKYIVENLNQYRIENVANNFIELTD